MLSTAFLFLHLPLTHLTLEMKPVKGAEGWIMPARACVTRRDYTLISQMDQRCLNVLLPLFPENARFSDMVNEQQCVLK